MRKDQDQNISDTDTSRETADNKPTGVADITGATYPLGVSTPHTKEDSNQDDEDNVNVNERCQKEKDR